MKVFRKKWSDMAFREVILVPHTHPPSRAPRLPADCRWTRCRASRRATYRRTWTTKVGSSRTRRLHRAASSPARAPRRRSTVSVASRTSLSSGHHDDMGPLWGGSRGEFECPVRRLEPAVARGPVRMRRARGAVTGNDPHGGPTHDGYQGVRTLSLRASDLGCDFVRVETEPMLVQPRHALRKDVPQGREWGLGPR